MKIAEIRGLTETHPWLGWGLVIGVVAIAGLPPLGIFMSEFLVVSSTFARQPLLALGQLVRGDAGHLVDVGAGRERLLAGAGDDDCSDLVVLLERRNNLVKLASQRVAQGIQL